MVGHLEFLYAECQVVSPAVGKTVILLHPLLLLVGVSIRMERGCQQNNSLADGYRWPEARTDAVCLLLLLCVCVVLRISVHVCMSACCVFRVVRERARRRVYANARSVVALELCVCVHACACAVLRVDTFRPRPPWGVSGRFVSHALCSAGRARLRRPTWR